MTTLILSTSCAPLNRPPTSSQGGDSAEADDTTTDWLSDSFGNSGAANGKNICVTTGHSAVDHDSANGHGDTSCHRHASSSSSLSRASSKIIARTTQNRRHHGNRSVEKFIDKLQALPLQCDITIIPRAAPSSDLSVNTTSLNSNNDINNDIGGHDYDDDVIQKPIRITKQNFHPCGLDNIVRLDGTAVPAEFILSLANCSVRIDIKNEDDRERKSKLLLLPVQAVPSSFSFPSSNNVEDDLGQFVRGDTPHAYSGGEKHNVEEVAVSFDFSIAMDVYQRQLEESAAAAAELNPNRYSNPHGNSQSWNAHGTTTMNNMKTMKIDSIMSTLEEESQFIKKTLFVLGSFGCALLICMVWTIWTMERGRRVRRSSGGSSRVQVKKVFVDNVPCEINATSTATKSRGGGVTSLRSHPSLRSNGRAHFPEEISPIRSSVSLDEVEEVEKVDEKVAASGNKEIVHETLRLITPQDVTCSSNSSKNDKGRQSSSPRHWYEDFLSPKGCSKKAPRNRSADAVISSEHEEVVRSLFCSSSSSDSNKVVSPSMDNAESFDISRGTTSNTSVLNAPKKKVLVTPIEGTSFSPPPSDVSLLKLSSDIESSKSPLMMSTETEETQDSSTRGDLDEPSSSMIEVVDEDKSCTISPASMRITEASTGTTKPVCTPVNTPKPKRSRALKTPATDISISSQESQASASLKARKIFAEELARKAGLTPNSTEKSDFSTSIARRAAEVQTPKKTLTPLSADSSVCDDEPSPFLADYW
ncbi:hypothetical protein ACHAWT_004950 [Skeletonema menzelii]